MYIEIILILNLSYELKYFTILTMVNNALIFKFCYWYTYVIKLMICELFMFPENRNYQDIKPGYHDIRVIIYTNINFKNKLNPRTWIINSHFIISDIDNALDIVYMTY